MNRNFVNLIIICLFLGGCWWSDDKTEKRNYPTGELMLEVEVNKEGNPHGVAKNYDKSGKLIGTTYYINGLENGKRVAYHDNGNVRFEEEIKDGKRNGSAIYYYPNGRKEVEVNYIDDKQNGWNIGYYENGNIKTKTPYKNGVIDGTSIAFFEDGATWVVEYYKDGMSHGIFVSYYRNGLLHDFALYGNNDQLYIVKYDSTGAIDKGNNLIIVTLSDTFVIGKDKQVDIYVNAEGEVKGRKHKAYGNLGIYPEDIKTNKLLIPTDKRLAFYKVNLDMPEKPGIYFFIGYIEYDDTKQRKYFGNAFVVVSEQKES